MRKSTLITLAVGLAALSPFAYLPEPVLLETPRFAALLAAGAAFLALWALRALAPPDAPWRRLALPAGAVAVAAGLSAALSFSPALAFTFGAERSLLPLPAWLAMLAVFVVAARLPLGKREHDALTLAAFVAAALAAVAVVQGLGGAHSAEGIFGNADYMGVVVLLFLPLFAVGYWRARKPAERAAMLAGLVVLASAAIVGNVVTVLVAFAAEALLLVALTPSLARYRRAAAAGGVAVLGLGVLGVALGALGTAFPQLFGFAAAIASQPTFASRYELWRAGWASFTAHPLLGAGPDGMPLASQAAVTAKLMQLEGAIGYAADVLVRDPHSLPLLALGELGVLGGAALLWLAAAWVLALRVRLRESDRLAPVRLAYAAGVAGFLFAMLLVPWTVRFAAMPALLAGLAVAPEPSRKPDAPSAEVPSWAPLLLALAVGVALVPGVAAIRGDQAIGAAKAATTVDGAHDGYASAVALQPTRPYPRYELAYLAGYRLSVQGAGTLTEYQALVDRMPKEVRECGPYLGLLVQPSLDQAQIGGRTDLRWEKERLAAAAKLSPDDPDVVLEEAHLALLEGRLAEAGRLLAEVRSWNSPYPRLGLYEALLKKAEKDPDAADAMTAALTKAPYLAFLSEWRGR